MPNNITKETETRLINAVEQAVELVNSGLDPNSAIVKVASDFDLTPGHVKLVVQAFNIGRTNAHRKAANDLYDRASEFELANIENIFQKLYPDKPGKKTKRAADYDIVSLDYWQLPNTKVTTSTTEIYKIASAEKLENKTEIHEELAREKLVKRAFKLLHETENQRRGMSTALEALMVKLAQEFDLLEEAIRPLSKEEFAYIKKAATVYLGPIAHKVLDRLRQPLGKSVKHAAFSAINWDKPPYKHIKNCVDYLNKYSQQRDEYEDFCKEASYLSRELYKKVAGIPDFHPYSRSVLPPELPDVATLEKVGVVGEAVVATTAVEATRKFLNKFRGEKDKMKAMFEIGGPEHEAELREAQIRLMLNDLIANDEVISGYDKKDVLEAYNYIASMSPRAATQPALVRALLRRYLTQGALDTHEIQQLADIEFKFKQKDAPSAQSLIPFGDQLKPLFGYSNTSPGTKSNEA